jgi:hypothetical protein
MSTRARLTTSAVAALTAAVVSAGPARAMPTPQVPPEVAAAFAGDALRTAQASSEGMGADFSGSRAGDIHEVFWFSADFTAGRPTTAPVRSSGTWLAGLERGNDVLGTLLVRRPDGGPAEWAGASAEASLGTTLRTLSPTELLVEDAPNGAYYALAGETARPLNDWARKAVARPTTVSGLQAVVARQYAQLRAQRTEPGTSPWLVIVLVGVGVASAVAGGLVFRRRRRSPSLP